MKKYTILFLDIPLDPPGGGQFSLLLLLKHLDRELFESVIFESSGGTFFDILIRNGFDARVVPQGSLFGAINELKPDIIHSNCATTRYSFIGALYGRIFNVPCILHVRVLDRAAIRDRILYAMSDRIIAISEAVKNKFNRTDKTVVIHNGVDLAQYDPSDCTSGLKEILALPAGAKIIGTIGRLDLGKGHRYLLDAAVIMIDEMKLNVHFIIVGSSTPEQLASLTAYARSSGIDKHVTFSGFRSDVCELISLMDIFVHPASFPEGFGRTIVEAMAMGKPVVSTRGGGVLDVIDEGITGVFVPVNDSRAIADACLMLLNNPSKMETMGKAARKSVEERFTAQNTALKVMKLYREILGI